MDGIGICYVCGQPYSVRRLRAHAVAKLGYVEHREALRDTGGTIVVAPRNMIHDLIREVICLIERYVSQAE